jgi:hypothetical protein
LLTIRRNVAVTAREAIRAQPIDYDLDLARCLSRGVIHVLDVQLRRLRRLATASSTLADTSPSDTAAELRADAVRGTARDIHRTSIDWNRRKSARAGNLLRICGMRLARRASFLEFRRNLRTTPAP